MENRTLTRRDLRIAVIREVGLSQNECSDFVENVLSLISDALVRGEQVKITSFGTFRTRDKAERWGRNPKTKVPALIDARRVVTFHASRTLKDRIRDGNKGHETVD
ncbi:MAG: integration host factor subunit alpha [Paracoccaceae bacterium]|nr:integration host factor subunit alpha [Paracoccaceae bacterium]MDE2913183.1 integration host factor subunit alpha [Paracoccaceae bacterium]